MTVRFLSVCALALAVSACQEPAAPPAVVATDAPAAESPATGPLAPVVEAERLAGLLPAEVSGAAQTRLVADQDSAMSLTVSRAAATYGGGPDSLTVLLLDVGSAEGARLMGLAEAASETSVRTLRGGRYVVEASGAGASEERLRAVADAVDLSALPGGS